MNVIISDTPLGGVHVITITDGESPLLVLVIGTPELIENHDPIERLLDVAVTSSAPAPRFETEIEMLDERLTLAIVICDDGGGALASNDAAVHLSKKLTLA